MSTQVDERIAKLSLDFDDFENNSKHAISTIQKLEESLTFKGAKAGVSSLTKLIAGVSFGPLIYGPELATKNIETFAQIGIGALRQLGAEIGSVGAQWVKSVTIGPISNGFKAYEENISAIQTIINTSGEGIEKVTEYTDKLRWFTDETSYHYDAMISAIGKFTSNNVKLEDATTAMIGISTAAGYFGVNANKAEHAMEGFAKAIGRGYMDRRNWQWIHTAQMATSGFKEELINAAVEVGTLKKAGDGLYKTAKGNTVAVNDFESALSDAWLTNDVLLKSFHKFGDATEEVYKLYLEEGGTVNDIIRKHGSSLDAVGIKALRAAQETKTFTEALEYAQVAVKSQWSRTFEYIFGNYEEARKLWSALSDELYEVFVVGNEERNNALAEWKVGDKETGKGGRDDLLTAVANMYFGIKEFVKPMKDVWETLFPPVTSDLLINLTTKFKEFADKFRAAMNGISEVIKPTIEFVEETVDKVEEIIEPVQQLTETLDEMAQKVIRGDFGNGQVRFDALEKLGWNYKIVQNRVNELLGSSYRYEVEEGAMAQVTQEVADALAEEEEELADWEKIITEDDSMLGRFRRTIIGVYSALQIAAEVLHEIGTSVRSVFKTIGKEIILPFINYILGFTSAWGDSLFEIYRSGELVTSTKEKIQEITESINTFITNSSKKFQETIGPTVTKVIGWLKKAWAWIVKAGKGIYKYLEPHLKTIKGYLDQMYKKYAPKIEKNLPKVLSKISGLLEKIWKLLGPIITTMIDNFVKNLPTIGKTAEKLGGKLWEILSWIWDKFEWVLDKLKIGWDNLIEFISTDRFQAVVDKVKKSLDDLVSFIGTIFGGIGSVLSTALSGLFGGKKEEQTFFDQAEFAQDAITRTMEPPETKGIIDSVETVADKFSSFTTMLSEKKESVQNFFAAFQDDTSRNFTTVTTSLGGILNLLGGTSVIAITTLGHWLQVILETIGKITSAPALKTFFDGIGKFLENLGTQISNWKLEDLTGVIKQLSTAGFFVILYKIADAFNKISDGVKDIPKNFNGMMESISRFLNGRADKYYADAMLVLAQAFGIMVLAIVGLSFADLDAVERTIGMLAAFSLMITPLAKVLTTFMVEWKKMTNVTKSLQNEADAQAQAAKNTDTQKLLTIFMTPLSIFLQGIKEAAMIWAKKGRFGNFLKNVGITFLLLAATIKIISDIEIDDLYKAGAVMAALAVGLTGMVAVLWAIKKVTQVSKVVQDSVLEYSYSDRSRGFTFADGFGFIAIATSMIILVKALKNIIDVITEEGGSINEAKLNAIYGIIFFMSVMVVALGVAVRVMSHYQVKVGQSFGNVIMLAGLAGMLFVFGQAVAKLGKIHKTQLNKGLKAISIITVCILALSFALKNLKSLTESKNNNGWGLAKTGVGLIAMAAGFAAVIAALGYLGDSKDKITAGVKAIQELSIPLLILFAIIAALAVGDFGTGGKLSETILNIGVGIAALSVGLLALSAALLVAGFALPIFLNGLAKAGEIIHEHGEEIKAGLIALISIVTTAVVAAILGKKDDLFGSMKGLATTALKKLLSWLLGHKILLYTIVGVGILIVVGALAYYCPDIVSKLIDFVSMIMLSLADALINRAGKLGLAFMYLVEALGIVILDALQFTLTHILPLILTALTDGLLWVMDGLSAGWSGKPHEPLSADDYKEIYNMYMGLGDGVDDAIEKTTGKSGWHESVTNDIHELQEEIKNEDVGFANAAAVNAEAYTTEFSDDISNPQVRAQVRAAAATNVDTVKEETTSGFDIFFDLLSKSGYGDKISLDMLSQLGNYSGDYKGVTEDYLIQMIEGYDANKDGVIDEADGVAGEAFDEVVAYCKLYPGVGINDLNGWAEGVRKTRKIVIDEYLETARQALEATKIVSDQNSPSKEYAKVGRFDMLGWAQGVLDNGQIVTDAYTFQAKNALESMRSTLYSVSQTLGEDLNSAPVIRPVLDLENINQNRSALNALFGNRVLNIGSITTREMRMAGEIESAFGTKIGELKNTINGYMEKEIDATIVVPVNIDGRETARVIAPYTRSELSRLDRNENRRNGRL